MDFFRETIFRPLKRASAIWGIDLRGLQGLLSLTRRGTPPKKSWKHKIWVKIQAARVTSGIVEVFSLNCFMQPAITARGISSSWIDFALELAALGGLTSGYLAHTPSGTGVPNPPPPPKKNIIREN